MIIKRGKMMVLVTSVSGGETSMFMAGLIKSMFDLGELDKKYTSVKYVFANTGQERDETLEFVRDGAALLGIEIIWLESKTNHGIKKSSDYNVVDFDSADRTGSVFESMIKKYGIPNAAYPHCTRELKNEPIKQWCIDNFDKDYEIAIGIRTDESKRQPKTNTYRTVYPLIDLDLSKQDVLDYWESQPFRLNIDNYQGNCKWCWKKSDKKLMLIAHENRQCLDFPAKMEEKHGLAGSNFDGTKRKFFRGHRSAADILLLTDELITNGSVYQNERKRIVDDYSKQPISGGCSESCEAFTQESLFENESYHTDDSNEVSEPGTWWIKVYGKKQTND